MYGSPTMNEVIRRACMALLSGVLLSASSGCAKIESSGAVCGYGEDGGAIDTRGRPDGLYAVRADQVGATPLVTFDHMKRTSEGLDSSSGKRWFGIHLDEEAVRAIHAFTSEATARRQLAIVAGGEIASIHAVKDPVNSSDVQIRCCNPGACERWNASLEGAK